MPVAVIGMACRLPQGIDTPEALWQAFAEGRDAFRTFALSRDRARFEKPWGKRYAAEFAAGAALMDRVDLFDAPFFGISNREARRMDPQQRMLLEETWKALEDAAIPPSDLRGKRAGVFIGLSSDDYATLTFEKSQADSLDTYSGTGTHRSMAAGRIAHFLGITGPVIQLDTACSSSLVAIHLACQNLQAGECELAIVGGAHVILDPRTVIARGMLKALAPDGRCKPFSSSANGFGMGEGLVMFVLKLLERAVEDGDLIAAVIRSSAVGHNGPGAGLTVPNPQAQAAIMRDALKLADVSPDSVAYLEAHGTGTSLGDPIEIEAIQQVYGARSEPLLVGSAKSNFGHLEAAAGGLSLMKAVLALQHGVVPPNLHSAILNPRIDWQHVPVRVAADLAPWPESKTPRRAAVSSFGMSGTNCHVILEEGPQPAPSRNQVPDLQLFVVSARSERSLRALGASFANWLGHESPDLSAVGHTLRAGRAHLEHRVAFVAQHREQVRSLFSTISHGQIENGIHYGIIAVAQKFPKILLRVGEPSAGARTALAALAADFPQLRAEMNACSTDLANSGDPLLNADRQICAEMIGLIRLLESWLKHAQVVPVDPFGERLVDKLLQTQRCGSEMRAAIESRIAGPDHLVIDLASDIAKESFAVPESARAFWDLLADLYVHGAELSWKRLNGNASRKIRLPVYPFDGQSLWLDATDADELREYTNEIEREHYMPKTLENVSSRNKEIEADLVAFVADVLEANKAVFKIDQPLLQLGADSLTLAEIVGFVERRYHVQIALRMLFEELLSIQAIAAYIVEQSGNAGRVALTAPPQAAPHQSVPVEVRVAATPLAPAAPEPKPAAAAAFTAAAQAASRPELAYWVQENQFSVPESTRNTALHAPPVAPQVHREEQVPTEKSHRRELTPAQQECAERIVTRLYERTRTSANEAYRARKVVCNNRRSLSQVNSETQLISYPIRASRSRGAHFEDVDGNDYVDISMGYGVHLFGHNPEFIVDALKAQLAKGMHLGPECNLVGEVAEGITQLTSTERVLFCNSGTEAVMTALRLVRAATGRKKIVLFRNAYHGHFDGTLVNPTSGSDPSAQPLSLGTTEGMVADMLVLPYDSPRALSAIEERAGEIAGVLVEPVQNRRPDLHPREFLHSLRELTRRYGIPLIFDEILIGFRIHQNGGQGWFNVAADLVTYAKVIGGGMPIGVVAGRAAVMDRTDGGLSYASPGDPPPVEAIYTAGTYCKHPLALAASRAVIGELRRRGPTLQEKLNQRTDDFVKTLNSEMKALGTPVSVYNCGSFFRFAQNGNLSFIYQPTEMDLFNAGMISRGVYIAEGGTSFLSTAHTEEDVGRIVEAAVATARELQEGGFWPEPNRSVPTSRPSQPREETKQTRAPRFSLSFFGAYANGGAPWSYDFTIAAARRAEELGFSALWFPERHFHEFGGLSPNPSLLAAAVSRETKHISLRAGSVVVPLHNPVRVAEEWAVVDRLSGGRVQVAFASGWHSDDFVLAPEAFSNRRHIMDRSIQTIQALWHGESVKLRGINGDDVTVSLYPKPVQPSLPIWLAALGNIETFEKAGALGAGVLTNLILQNVDQLREKIAAYRAALRKAGHPPEKGRVAVLVHTFLSDTEAKARELAAAPLKRYLQSSVDLASRTLNQGQRAGISELSAENREYLFDQAVTRYIERNSLIGSSQSCDAMISQLVEAGADEIAAFIDFGVDAEEVMRGLEHLNDLRTRWESIPQVRAHSLIQASPVVRTESPGPTPTPVSAVTLPTTPNQQMLLLASRLDMPAYQVRTTLELPIEVDVRALERALQRVVDRHEALRATFPGDDGDQQQIRDNVAVDLRVLDLMALPQNIREQELSKWFDRDSRNPLNLEQGPVFRFTLLRVESTRHLLVATVHHAVYDGIAEQVLTRDIAHFYNAELGKAPGNIADPTSYIEVVQKSLAGNPEAEKRNLEFWSRLLLNFQALRLPFDKTPPLTRTTSGRRLQTTIEPSVRSELRRIAAENLTTPFILILTAYAVFLHELCEQDDLLIGISLTNRRREQHHTLIANCSNMLPVRSVLSGSQRFVDHLRTIRDRFLEIQEHAEVPFAHLVEKFGKPIWSAPPLVSTCFNWDHSEPPVFADVQAKLRPDPTTSVRFPLSLNIAENSGEWNLEWDFNTDLFNEESITSFAARFSSLLASICRHDGEVPLKREDCSPAALVRDRILSRCQQRSRLAAVIDEQTTLSYELLEQQSAALSQRLTQLGVRKGDVVALRLPTSAQSVVAMLAIWRAGAGFAPLDNSAPAAWIEKLLREIRPKVIIATASDVLPKSETPVLLVDDEQTAFTGSTSTKGVTVAGEDLAYVICTSGSTGTPKCVAVSHENLSSYVDAINERLNWDATGNFLLVSPFHVDLGYTVIFPALSGGGALHVASDTMMRAPGELAKFLSRGSVDYLKITPTHLAALMEHEEAAAILPRKAVVLGGEPLSWELVDRLWRLAPNLAIFNHYGPTETTVGVLTYRVQKQDPSRSSATVPVGFPLPHVQVDVIGPDGSSAPEGTEGEIVVTGRGVASGYLQPDGTVSPFTRDSSDAAPRFTTGDIAQRTKDGAIIFRHRRDEQIKIRGFRVDLAEVRGAILAQGSISDAQLVPNRDHTALICWVVPRRAELPFDARSLTKYLEDHLPAVMRPNKVVVIEKLPMTKSGKVDRALLRTWTCNEANGQPPHLAKAAAVPDEESNPVSQAATLAAEPSHNDDGKIESMMTLWREVLKRDDLRQDQSFFELGGDSISAIKLIGRIRRKFGVDISIRNLFDYPTPGAILHLVQDLKTPQAYVKSA